MRQTLTSSGTEPLSSDVTTRNEYWPNNARVRANKTGIPCTITHEDVVIPTHCPLLGIPLDHTKGVRHDGSPTLDKIRPELGYVPGNVRVVSWLANAVKRDLTPEQLLTFARNIGPYLR